MADAALCPARFVKTGRCQACWTFAYAEVSGGTMSALMLLSGAAAWHAASPGPVDSSMLITAAGLLLRHHCLCMQLCSSIEAHLVQRGICDLQGQAMLQTAAPALQPCDDSLHLAPVLLS